MTLQWIEDPPGTLGQLPTLPTNWTGIPEPPGWTELTGMPWPPTGQFPPSPPPACAYVPTWPCTPWPPPPPPGWPQGWPWPLPVPPLPGSAPPIPPPVTPTPGNLPPTPTTQPAAKSSGGAGVAIAVGAGLLLLLVVALAGGASELEQNPRKKYVRNPGWYVTCWYRGHRATRDFATREEAEAWASTHCEGFHQIGTWR